MSKPVLQRPFQHPRRAAVCRFSEPRRRHVLQGKQIATITESESLGAPILERDEFQIRVATREVERAKCDSLVNRLYSPRGYASYPITSRDDLAEVTLQACRGPLVFGTLTVRFDSARGLAADQLYQDEIDSYRREGRSVAELTRLAVQAEHGSKELLGALFHAAYVLGALRYVGDAFIEVNPRHSDFYRRMLDFERVGDCRLCARVNAPAVLLRVDVGHVGAQAALHGGRRALAGSLYPYFCSPDEEALMLARTVLLDCSAASDRPLIPRVTPQCA